MRKWILSIVPMTALIAGTAVAGPAPVWSRDASETEVRGRVTGIEPLNPPGSGSEVVIENGERVFVSPAADVALYDVRPGDEVDARYIEHGNGDKSMLSLVPPLNELQAP